MTLFNHSSGTTRYKLAGQMKGHTDAVHSLALTKGGRILASGGELSFRRKLGGQLMMRRVRWCSTVGYEGPGSASYTKPTPCAAWPSQLCVMGDLPKRHRGDTLLWNRVRIYRVLEKV
jgi:hypothetical protein